MTDKIAHILQIFVNKRSSRKENINKISYILENVDIFFLISINKSYIHLLHDVINVVINSSLV